MRGRIEADEVGGEPASGLPGQVPRSHASENSPTCARPPQTLDARAVTTACAPDLSRSDPASGPRLRAEGPTRDLRRRGHNMRSDALAAGVSGH